MFGQHTLLWWPCREASARGKAGTSGISPFDFLPNKRRTALRIEPFLSAPSAPVPLPIEYRADLRLRGLGLVSVLPSPSAWGWAWDCCCCCCCAAAVTDVKCSAEGRP
jgi:hypothetical protein